MQARELRGHKHHADRAFSTLALAAAGLVVLILGMIAVTMARRAWPAFGAEFFASTRWSAADEIFGALPFVWGTLYTAAIAVVIAVPVSLGVALFITQVAPPWLKRPMVYLIDLLAVVPSVVFGLWGVLVLSQHAGLGRSFLTAGIILAIMIVPIITSLSREVIETTPASEKEAALALGATRWEMISASVLPHSKGGLVGAVMLGLGRAMGETIAAATVAELYGNRWSIERAFGELTLSLRGELQPLVRKLFIAPLAFLVPAAVRELPAFRRVRTESFRPRVRRFTLQAIAGCEEIHCHWDLHHSLSWIAA